MQYPVNRVRESRSGYISWMSECFNMIRIRFESGYLSYTVDADYGEINTHCNRHINRLRYRFHRRDTRTGNRWD